MTGTILLWVVPPLVGAIIGYVTNAVAIKMLFRPLKEIRVFNIRLPFTPGILPRERHKLAESIGAMVERELLTPEIVRQRLRKEEFRKSLHDSVAMYTEKLISTPIGELSFRVPREGEDETVSGLSDISRFIAILLRDFFASPAFATFIDKIASNAAEHSGGRSVSDMLGPEKAEAFKETIERVIRDGLQRSSAQVSSSLVPVLEKAFPHLADSLFAFLRREEVHSELELHGRIFLNNAILKLSAFQRFFISAAQYDKTLHDRMPEIIDDLIRQLEELSQDPDTRERLIYFTKDTVERLLSAEESSERLAGFLTAVVSSYLDQPVGEIINRWTGGGTVSLGEKILGFARNFADKDMGLKIGQTIDRFLEKHRSASLAGIFSLNHEKKDAIDTFISEKILSVADERTTTILNSINIKAMVVERVDSLDMLSVEQIVLGVMANQLKWINVFGAILGAFIGIFQALFSWIMR
ncbi:DUF445 family protein [Breznakiella homolactica]|uniref:DUF445 family protein n=1 Tax=Breznakiella homolactica TaxID=2798577 RepID=A0A7T7XKP1_9SPIR|nr:DUF445 family protein [Breznakiella homolactica]QQO08065.1 DUF445 family protein [Breznakiella homolactica]